MRTGPWHFTAETKINIFFVFGTHPCLKIQPSVVLALHPGIFQRKDAGLAAAAGGSAGGSAAAAAAVSPFMNTRRGANVSVFYGEARQRRAPDRGGVARLALSGVSVVGGLKLSPRRGGPEAARVAPHDGAAPAPEAAPTAECRAPPRVRVSAV